MFFVLFVLPYDDEIRFIIIQFCVLEKRVNLATILIFYAMCRIVVETVRKTTENI